MQTEEEFINSIDTNGITKYTLLDIANLYHCKAVPRKVLVEMFDIDQAVITTALELISFKERRSYAKR